eukprot:scaffold11157_cov69-Phaeocystis_antarctica.AAC.5
MALSKLSGDEAGILFTQLCNVLEPRTAVYLSSACNELRTATQGLLQQLRADHEAATALGRKAGLRSCKELREAKSVYCHNKGLVLADLALLGTLGSVLPALEKLFLIEPAAGPDGVQRLVEGLGAGALPAVTCLAINYMHVGDAGASALAAALGRGALPRLMTLSLANGAIGDAGLVALAPALRRLPALEQLFLGRNPFGDEGLAALVAPPPPAGAPLLPPTGGLAKLKLLNLCRTQVTDAGCVTLAAGLNSGALPALERLHLLSTPASAAAIAAVGEDVSLAQRPFSPAASTSAESCSPAWHGARARRLGPHAALRDDLCALLPSQTSCAQTPHACGPRADMRPHYVEVPLLGGGGGAALYQYVEGGRGGARAAPPERCKLAVLFVHGNDGSHAQVRSIASVTAASPHGGGGVHFYTIAVSAGFTGMVRGLKL